MKVWIYLEGKQQGPFEMEELKSKPGFDENTRVWFEGLPKWYPAGSLEQMKPLFEDVVSEVSETETTAEGTGHEAVVTEETPATEISMPAEQAEFHGAGCGIDSVSASGYGKSRLDRRFGADAEPSGAHELLF